MYFLLSGEGPTDLGVGMPGPVIAEGADYLYSPLALMVDQIAENRLNYSPLDVLCCGYLSKQRITERAAKLKAAKKALRLPGPRQAKEIRYFFNNARILSKFASEKAAERKDDVVAVLFRDSDAGASAGRGNWEAKRQLMQDGFDEESFSNGVPMIPKPTSESWLICALKSQPYHGCEQLEGRSSSQDSPHSLKGELKQLLGDVNLRETLCDLVRRRIIDYEKILMPSFSVFRHRLEDVIATLTKMEERRGKKSNLRA